MMNISICQVGADQCMLEQDPVQKDIAIVANELVKAENFVMHNETRKHSQFVHPKNILEAKDRKELFDWLMRKLPTSI